MEGDGAAMRMGNEALLEAVEILSFGSEEEQAATAEQLAAFTEDPKAVSARTAVGAAGALVPLIQLLSSPSLLVRLRSIQVILHLSRQKEFRDIIREEDGILPVCNLLNINANISTWDEQLAQTVDCAICTIVNLCNLNMINRDVVREVGGIHRLCALLVINQVSQEDDQPEACLFREIILERVTFAICALTSGNQPNKDEVREAGGIPPIVRVVAHPRADLRSAVICNAAQALQTLACHHEGNREALRLAGAIPPLLRLMTSGPDNPAAAYAAATFAAMATNNIANKDAMREHGVIRELVRLTTAGHHLPTPYFATACFATSCLMAMCYKSPANREAVREEGGIPCLLDLLVVYPPHPITEKAAWCLSNLAHHSFANQEEICANDGLPLLTALLEWPCTEDAACHESPQLVHAIAKA
eukprot:CAMPEP_0118958098 /NCGR_PEP_ID=MMETSP1169-20130426/62449_1 /TAXON_ID=36882 /ORGANISM="Pyramimonas obovata, Strain CCMP722" /LENGTH=417 /DNA_ID=CAMNT_0006906205 /DNA_START=155 /DNA_END=1405 /DNA_ORIENTATION=-